jgi:hypothetical protein
VYGWVHQMNFASLYPTARVQRRDSAPLGSAVWNQKPAL